MAYGAKTGGREKGTPNVMTRSVKANILDVFEEIGGVKNFAKWARENETEFYKHYTKLVPITLANDDEHPLVPPKIVFEVIDGKANPADQTTT